MEKQEAIETMYRTRDFTTEWYGDAGLTDHHRDQLADVAIGLTIAAALATKVTEDVDIQIPELGGLKEQAMFLAMSALIAAFQMGRASALGDEQK